MQAEMIIGEKIADGESRERARRMIQRMEQDGAGGAPKRGARELSHTVRALPGLLSALSASRSKYSPNGGFVWACTVVQGA